MPFRPTVRSLYKVKRTYEVNLQIVGKVLDSWKTANSRIYRFGAAKTMKNSSSGSVIV